MPSCAPTARSGGARIRSGSGRGCTGSSSTAAARTAGGAGSASEDHPAERVAWREEIEVALARLDPQQREAFLLKHVEDKSYEEMAELTGAGVSALKMRVKRACDRLRELLREVEYA